MAGGGRLRADHARHRPHHRRHLHAPGRRQSDEVDVMRVYFTDIPRTLLTMGYWAFVLYLLVPLTLMMAMSFKDANFVAFPIGDWTLRWYGQVMQDRQFLEACVYSIAIAAAATFSATVIGVWIAMLITKADSRWSGVLFALAC